MDKADSIISLNIENVSRITKQIVLIILMSIVRGTKLVFGLIVVCLIFKKIFEIFQILELKFEKNFIFYYSCLYVN